MLNNFVVKGRYKVVLGKSFDTKVKKRTPKLYNIKHARKINSKVFKREATLKRENEKYSLNMAHSGTMLSTTYDVEMTEASDPNDYILIFDEKAMTCTVERQSACMTLTDKPPQQPKLEMPPVQSKLHLPPKPSPPKSSPLGNSGPLPHSTNGTTIVSTPKHTPASPTAANNKDDISDNENDDFDFDISKDMDAILDADSDDDNKSDSESSEVFEEVKAPSLAAPAPAPALALAKPVLHPIQATNTSKPNRASNLSIAPTPNNNVNNNRASISPSIPSLVLPPTPTPSSAAIIQNKEKLCNNGHSIASTNNINNNNNLNSQSPANPRKRKLKMASAPIRHLDSPSSLKTATTTPTPPIPPAPAVASSSTPVSLKSLSANAPPIPASNTNKRRKITKNDDISNASNSSESSSSEDEDGSSSGSESGSTETSSSGEGESGSSESDTDTDDDDDFESLAQDISMSLNPSAPSSPQHPSLINSNGSAVPASYNRPAAYNSSTPSSVASTATGPSPIPAVNNTKKPMSLRALFKDDEESEESEGSDSD